MNDLRGIARDKRERRTVNAVAQPSRLRSVAKDVSEMPIAGAAQELCTRVPQFVIGARGDGLFGQDFKETRPPASAVVLVAAVE